VHVTEVTAKEINRSVPALVTVVTAPPLFVSHNRAMATPLISRDMELPQILSRYPRCRIIFDRYGLTGCGGALGPQEPLWFFARAHRVDEVQLIAELEEVASADEPHPGRPMFNPGPADTIYQRFFKAAILTMFTFGCVMGGVNLAVMAMRHQLASLDLRAVTWAHAHAQVAGWVTFFVMGFAYQAIPRFKFVPLWRPRLACATLWALAPALAIRATADLFLPNRTWLVAGVLAGAVEWAMAALFVLIIVQTIRQSKQPAEPYERFLIAALGWMLVAFGFDLWVFTQTAGVTGYRGWVNFIGRIDAPWRDLQLLGFAGTMILGVSQRFLPFIYGFREVPARTSSQVLWLWNISIAGNIAAYSLLVQTKMVVWGVALELSVLGLLASVAILVRAFGVFSVKVDSDRSLPFIRAAWAWSLVAMALFALMPVYTASKGSVFSHAYFGGYRHAFTVGFISMMIVGVSSKIVPVLCGLSPAQVSSLRATFWLINIGNGMRVAFQILTDSYPWAYPVMAASAWIEVTGLAVWAVDLWKAMGRRPMLASACAEVPLTLTARVADVAEAYPKTIPVFLQFGFTMITNPLMRRTVARSVTLEQVCRLRRVDSEELLSALRQVATAGQDATRRQDQLVTISRIP
jgi:hypothetical protein